MKRDIPSKAKSAPRSRATAITALTNPSAAEPVRHVDMVHTHLAVMPVQHVGREQLIAEAAYHHAEARGFEGGHELDDWLSAEAEVDARLCGEGRVY